MSRPLFVKVNGSWREGESVWVKKDGSWRSMSGLNVKVNGEWKNIQTEHIHQYEYRVESDRFDVHQYGAFCECGAANAITVTKPHNKRYILIDENDHREYCNTEVVTNNYCNYSRLTSHYIGGYTDIGGGKHAIYCPCGWKLGEVDHVFYSPQHFRQDFVQGQFQHMLLCSDCEGQPLTAIPVRCVDSNQDGFCDTCNYQCNYQT